MMFLYVSLKLFLDDIRLKKLCTIESNCTIMYMKGIYNIQTLLCIIMYMIPNKVNIYLEIKCYMEKIKI